MLTKHSDFNFQLREQYPALFFLIGKELFQVNHMADVIKASWQKKYPDDCSMTILDINSSSDWLSMAQEVNHYSLFSSKIGLDIRFDKKSLDANGKATLEQYLQHKNGDMMVLIRAPELPLKQLQAFVNRPDVQIILYNPPNKNATIHWLTEQIKKITPNYDQQIPTLIHQYNEGNLLASVQVLKKLQLIANPEEPLTINDVKEQLINQCDYPLFELATACLNSDSVKALQLIKQARHNKTEPVLILWILTREIRLIVQLLDPVHQAQPFKELANTLKIWSQHVRLYQNAIRKYRYDVLVTLLHTCNTLDKQIKNNQGKYIWQSFESITLSLCTGKQVGYLAE